jgi:predicted ATP-grasp superfamily ATP-dependent carboligase
VLKSWTVRNVGEVEKIADSLEFPLILKPRTHVRRRRNDKGEVVANLDQLTSALKRVEHSESFYGLSGDAESDFFMQRFVEVFPKGVLSVTGFIDRSGSRFVARAARKILLRSEPAGVGVCFESTPLDPALADQTARLCRTLGYFGVFEVEFVWDGAGWAAIDFNPRFYNQMALDIARGLPLARLCYYDAIGHTHRLAQLFEHANAASAESKLCVRDGFTMSLIVAFRSLTGRMLRDERRGWSAWSKRNRMGMLDLIHSHDDPWVWPVHMISEVRLGMRKLFSVAKNRIGRAGKSHA